MKLAISSEAFRGILTMEEFMKQAKAWGVRYMEIWPENLECKSYEKCDTAQLNDLMHKNDVEMACLTLYGLEKSVTSDPKQYSKTLSNTVRVAKELGAKYVCHLLYILGLPDDVDKETLLRYYEEPIRTAEECGVKLVLENVCADATSIPERFVRLVEWMDSDCFKVNYDLCNYLGGSVECYPYAYNVLRPYIEYIHLKGGCYYRPQFGHFKGGLAKHPVIGQMAGEELFYTTMRDTVQNVAGMLSNLEKSGYDGFVTLEPHTIPEKIMEYYVDDLDFIRGIAKFD